MSSFPLAPDVTAAFRERLRFAYLSLIAFMFVYYARPEDWIPGIHVIPLAKVTGVVVLLAIFFSVGQLRGRIPEETILLVLLLIQFFLASIFSSVWRGGAVKNTLIFAKLVPIVFVMPWVMNSISRLRQLIFLQTVCVAIISGVSIWKAHTTHGRLQGVLSGNYENPNDLACQIVICLPFCIAFLLRTRFQLGKVAWGFVILIMTYAVIVTGSRAGFLALIVAFSVCIWQFAIKGHHRSLLIFVVAAILLLPLFSGLIIRRFEAISSNKEDRASYESAQVRQQGLKDSLKVTARHPLFGVGPGNFEVVSAKELGGTWHSSHNTFLGLSSEGGLPALLLYLMILWRAFANLRMVKRHREDESEEKLWATALHASLWGFLIASVFASEEYQYFTYFLFAYATALSLIVRAGRVSSGTPAAAEDILTSNEDKDERSSESLQVYSSS